MTRKRPMDAWDWRTRTFTRLDGSRFQLMYAWSCPGGCD